MAPTGEEVCRSTNDHLRTGAGERSLPWLDRWQKAVRRPALLAPAFYAESCQEHLVEDQQGKGGGADLRKKNAPDRPDCNRAGEAGRKMGGSVLVREHFDGS